MERVSKDSGKDGRWVQEDEELHPLVWPWTQGGLKPGSTQRRAPEEALFLAQGVGPARMGKSLLVFSFFLPCFLALAQTTHGSRGDSCTGWQI